MPKDDFQQADIRLFRDRTSPLTATQVFATEPSGTVPHAEGGAHEESVVYYGHGGGKRDLPAGKIRSFTVGKHTALSSNEVHRFKNQNAVVVRALAARLALFLRMELTLEQTNLEVMDLNKFSKMFEAPRHMILFKIHPLEAIGVLDISKPLGLTIADRMLGGKAFAVNPDRPIREVETALLDQITQIILREWCRSWKFEDPLRATLLGHEMNPQFLQIGSTEETYYHVSIDASLGDCMDQIQMLLPVRGIDPIIRHLSLATSITEAEDETEEHEEYVRQPWNPAFAKVNVRVTAQWPDIPVLTRDMLTLKEGDIIPLEPERLSRVEICLEGKPKYIGRLGSLDQKCAVQIVQTINS
ncbi:MAG: hypothetical protein EXS22_05200 [Pedosphaera sp.]|nr:hypothetical protein [Pedosphaera sp.]